MHDLVLANDILSLVLSQTGRRKISRIKLQLREEGHITEENLKEAFRLISKNTLAEEAVLEVVTLNSDGLPEEDVAQARVLEIEVEEG